VGETGNDAAFEPQPDAFDFSLGQISDPSSFLFPDVADCDQYLALDMDHLLSPTFDRNLASQMTSYMMDVDSTVPSTLNTLPSTTFPPRNWPVSGDIDMAKERGETTTHTKSPCKCSKGLRQAPAFLFSQLRPRDITRDAMLDLEGTARLHVQRIVGCTTCSQDTTALLMALVVLTNVVQMYEHCMQAVCEAATDNPDLHISARKKTAAASKPTSQIWEVTTLPAPPECQISIGQHRLSKRVNEHVIRHLWQWRLDDVKQLVRSVLGRLAAVLGEVETQQQGSSTDQVALSLQAWDTGARANVLADLESRLGTLAAAVRFHD